ncbi:MAG: leucine-rich repeat domain-containing protein [Bacteroidaceae bacterium]|nr:leucine-rich repeat domain-containing protein [Bacteroidaceae bacterium]
MKFSRFFIGNIFVCLMLSLPTSIQAQELGATFSAATQNGVAMTFQLVDTTQMNIQAGTWDGACAIDTVTQGQVIIPTSAGGMKVVAIAPGAFKGCSGVTAINVPAYVATIGERAFAGMSSLDTLVVSTTNSVFDSRNNCNAVVEKATNTLVVGCRSSVIDPTVTAIGPSAFEGSGISTVVLSADITAIGERAFAACESLTTITSLSTEPFAVNANCFPNPATLELYVPLGSKAKYLATEGWNSIENIYEIGAPEEVTDEQGVCYQPHYTDGSYVYSVKRLNMEHLAEIVIPSAMNDYPVTAVGDTAFADRTALTAVTLPSSIESIGDGAFVGCSALTTLTMLSTTPPAAPMSAFDNVSDVTLQVPLGCSTAYTSVEPWSYFTNVNVLGAPEVMMADGVIYTPIADGDVYTYTITGHEDGISGSLKLLADVGGYPVTAIAAEAFSGCTGLTGTLTLPTSIHSIGDHAFMGCTGLTSSVNIPAGVSSIGINPFAGCTGITAFSVDASNSSYDARNNSNAIIHTATNTLVAGSKGSQFPDDIIAIAPYAFFGQSSLQQISIPEGVTIIGDWAFYGCDNISLVVVSSPGPPTISENVFSSSSTAKLYVVKGTKELYANSAGWQDFSYIGQIGVPDEYRDAQGIDYTPYEVEDIYVYAVTGHQNAMPSSITIPDYISSCSVERIEAGVFSGSLTLSSVTLPENMMFIGDSAFAHCQNMTKVNIPISAQYIGNSAFSGCKHLLSVAIPAATVQIGKDAFLGCSALETITVDAGNQVYDAREDCNAIIETATNTLLYGSGSTVIPSSVSVIAENAFRNNTVLTSVTIPANIEQIGANAFNGCDALTTVTCKAKTPLSVSEGIFSNLSYMTLIVPTGTKAQYEQAAVWQDFSTIVEETKTYDTEYAIYIYNEEQGGYEFSAASDNKYVETRVPTEVNGMQVVSVNEGAFAGKTDLQVLTWENQAPVAAACFASPEEHGNLLVFVASDSAQVTYQGNVIRSILSPETGRYYEADEITLYDARPMTNPQAFTAKHVSITKEFAKETIIGQTSGWETIVVPFDVDSITTGDGQLIAPFGSEAATDLHFWLAEMDENAGFRSASQIRANIPYIISMPNSENYIERFRISGGITFHGTDVEVQPTANAISNAGPSFALVPTYQGVEAADSVFVLNDEVIVLGGEVWPAGSVFVRSSRAARPFEAYTYANEANGGNVKGYIPLDEISTGIRSIQNSLPVGGDQNALYDLSGRRISTSLQSDGKQLRKGLYIKNGKKTFIK